MYQRPHNPIEHACNCACPIHHGKPRQFFTDPGRRCLISCASRPLTVHSPQTGGALFLDRQNRIWHVPGIEPGCWDWHNAIHSDTDAGYPLISAEPVLIETLRRAGEALAELDLQ
jgi:hypothetical protein